MAYQVQNFIFETEEEAKRAQKEAQAIALIKTRLAASQPETALTIHKQLLEKDLFTTKLGLAFMAEIRGDDTAIEAESSESADASDKSQATGATSKSKSKIRKNSKPSYRSESSVIISYKRRIGFYRVICATMLLIILGMLFIASTSNSTTILNYEQQLIDKYASWAEELSIRESEVLKREQALE